MRTIRVAAVQFEHRTGDKEANLQTVERFTECAAARGVQLIAFPECCISGCWFLRKLNKHQLTNLAEPVFEGPACRRLLTLATKHHMTVAAGLLEMGSDGSFYNTYVVAMPDGTAKRHRKLHAFEHALMKSGSKYTVFDTPHGFRLGVLICYDNNIVENVRITALMGAEILLAPHHTGGCRTQNPHMMGLIDAELWHRRHEDPEAIEREFRGDKGRGWLLRWLPSRAHDNGLFLVFSNSVGIDDDEVRTGNCMILDPYGRILAETWKAGEDMVVADLDATLLEHNTGRSWMAARRPGLYGLVMIPTGRERSIHELKGEE